MRKKNIENVPVRTFDTSLSNNRAPKFNIEVLKEDNINTGITVEAHRHDYYHIMYVKNGIGKHSVDFKTYKVLPNTIFFISPGQVHSLEIDKDIEGYVISFNSDFYLLNNSVQKLMDFPFFHSLYNEPVMYLTDKIDEIQYFLEGIFVENKSLEKGNGNLLRALMEVFLIKTSRIYTQTNVNVTPNHLSFQLRKLEALIDSNFKELKQLNDYADLMYISPKHLNSLCKKGLNKTVTNLIHERIIIEAKRLLLFTNNSISEVALELGFTEKSYFMRFFKKHTLLTADSFRKQEKLK